LSRIQYQNSEDSDIISHGFEDLLAAARQRFLKGGNVERININPGRPSPLTSPLLGKLVLRALSERWLDKSPVDLLFVMEIATAQSPTFLLHGHQMGVDEVLCGRSGLLWAILEIRKRCPEGESRAAFAPVFQHIHKLVQSILAAGRAGAQLHRQTAGDGNVVNMPLMWSWFDHFFSLGAMHGIAGVLTVLLDSTLPRHALPIVEAYEEIAQSITALCQLCIANEGHLPMSIPARPSKHSTPLVQICHGTPGILILLATAKDNKKFASQFWRPEFDQAISLASEVVWKQGLLSKGCSLCHGIAGNALSLLSLASGETRYRSPDHPWSLFEGLAGFMVALSEAKTLVEMKLGVLKARHAGTDDDAEVKKAQRNRLLGFPWLSSRSNEED
jgi:hypothetical protein